MKKKSEYIKKDLGKFKALQVLSLSDGGKILKDTCLKDIISTIDMIALTAKPLKLEEYIAHAAKLAEKITMYRVLMNCKKNVELTQEALEEALQEEAEE